MTPVFVLERPDGRLGGFLEAGTRKYAEGCVTAPVGYIEGWFVDENLRRQGHGHELVNAAEDWARSQGPSTRWAPIHGSIMKAALARTSPWATMKLSVSSILPRRYRQCLPTGSITFFP